MDEFLASSIIEWYEDLEERLEQYIKFTPFITQNLNVCSPRLAGVITEACNILDSLFREISPPTVTVNGKPKDRERLDITDYADLYAGHYTLPATKSVIFVSPPQYLVPFKAWESITAGGAYAPLSWWTAHNKLKHDRIGHILDKSTLRNTVDAICGLHQVIAKLPQLARATLRHGWLQTSDMNPEFVITAREGAP